MKKTVEKMRRESFIYIYVYCRGARDGKNVKGAVDGSGFELRVN